jgi:hypothetical protein
MTRHHGPMAPSRRTEDSAMKLVGFGFGSAPSVKSTWYLRYLCSNRVLQAVLGHCRQRERQPYPTRRRWRKAYIGHWQMGNGQWALGKRAYGMQGMHDAWAEAHTDTA